MELSVFRRCASRNYLNIDVAFLSSLRLRAWIAYLGYEDSFVVWIHWISCVSVDAAADAQAESLTWIGHKVDFLRFKSRRRVSSSLSLSSYFQAAWRRFVSNSQRQRFIDLAEIVNGFLMSSRLNIIAIHLKEKKPQVWLSLPATRFHTAKRRSPTRKLDSQATPPGTI